jgi:hypothetical protein
VDEDPELHESVAANLTARLIGIGGAELHEETPEGALALDGLRGVEEFEELHRLRELAGFEDLELIHTLLVRRLDRAGLELPELADHELHQERVAKERSRPAENKWIGQRISGPDVDLAMMARAQGAEGIGPITKVADLRPAIEKGIEAVRAGGVCVVDVHVLPGYDSNMGGATSHKR